MVDQNIPLQGASAPEVAAALLDLAQLAQHTGSATVENLDSIADSMLSRLLLLCSAQRGAIYLGVDERLEPELTVSQHKVFRSLALQGIDDEAAYELLSALPIDVSNVKSDSELACWLTYKLPLGEFFLEKEQFSDSLYQSHSNEELPFEDRLLSQIRHPLVALLVIGWIANEDNKCASLVERGRHILPYVVDAIGAVIVGILQVERIHELEVTRNRDSLREMELLKAELLGTVSHELRSPLASIKGYAATLLRHERRISREERHQFLLAITEASDRLEIIIQRLLEVSQLETDEATIDRSPVDMEYLV